MAAVGNLPVRHSAARRFKIRFEFGMTARYTYIYAHRVSSRHRDRTSILSVRGSQILAVENNGRSL